ncbi:MAG: hypothetical protein JRN56_04710 [Nitrososphaerota archaeon]|nr:hypothetical protein [Nitrososphaerota archaeon]MDG6913151.1 hypothetical protein [Nitrososphaerota archaeon]MDG6937088.1 hypothetical protein [Nitrososphaerota archaeon]MDG6971053.1 hypothetical protein [Nitrososphaerota archaeon]MDG6972329.1 hypothetical protein [Nitrososphaerota archaeon]
MIEREEESKEMRVAESNSLLFKGPTVVAALVCAVAAVFFYGVGIGIIFAPVYLQGTFLVDLSTGNAPSQGLLNVVGAVIVTLGLAYVISAYLLWSEKHWIKGVYAGIVVSIVGMLESGLDTTFAPGMAAAGMIVNVLIVTLLATETWEARRRAL